MKNKNLLSVLFIAVTFLLISFNTAYAQRMIKNYNEAITVNPLGLAFGILNVNYEMQVSRENSLTIGGVYLGYQGWTGLGINGSYKWYLFQDEDKAIKGFSFGPTVSVTFLNYENNTYNDRMGLAIGGEATYKWIIDDFVIEPVFGINFNVLNESGLDWRPYYLGVNVGYAW